MDSFGVFAQARADGRASGKRRNLDFALIHYFGSFFGVNIESGGPCSQMDSESSQFKVIRLYTKSTPDGGCVENLVSEVSLSVICTSIVHTLLS